jgi:glycosyltransferase involved in cell wall biosynthesis
LGLASLESQACGTPVIVADEGGLPETIEPDRTGFAVRRNPAAAAAALRLLAEPAIRPAMSSAAARRPAPRDDIAAARLYQMFDQLGSRARADRSFA